MKMSSVHSARSGAVPGKIPFSTNNWSMLLTQDGGTVRAGVVAKRMGVTPATVEQLRSIGRLLAVPVEHGFAYPAWQFDGRGMLSGLPTVLKALSGYDAWAQLAFLLTPHSRLDGRRPLDVLREGGFELVRQAAQARGQ